MHSRKAKGKRSKLHAPKFPDVKTEGPLRKPYGFYARMADSELIGYARTYCRENRITTRKQLSVKDGGLYYTLNMRRLLPLVIPNSRTKGVPIRWPTDDEEVIHIAKAYCDVHGITTRGQLFQSNPKLYDALRRRNLFEAVGLKAREEKLCSKSDQEILGLALGICITENITKRAHFHTRYPTLYTHLLKRNLLGKVIPESLHKHRRSDWKQLTDSELVEMGQDHCLIYDLKSRTGLAQHYFSLYNELRTRGLLKEVMPKGKTGPKPESLPRH